MKRGKIKGDREPPIPAPAAIHPCTEARFSAGMRLEFMRAAAGYKGEVLTPRAHRMISNDANAAKLPRKGPNPARAVAEVKAPVAMATSPNTRRAPRRSASQPP